MDRKCLLALSKSQWGRFTAYGDSEVSGDSLVDSPFPLTFKGPNLFDVFSTDNYGKQGVIIEGSNGDFAITSTADYGRIGYAIHGLSVGKQYTLSGYIKKEGTHSSSIRLKTIANWEDPGTSYGYLFSRASPADYEFKTFSFTATSSDLYIGFYISAASAHPDTIRCRGFELIENGLGRTISRTESVDLGSLAWGTSSSYTGYSTGIQSLVKKPSSYSVKADISCNGYTTVVEQNISTTDKAIAISTGGLVLINDSELSGKSASEIKAALSGVILYYEPAVQKKLRSACSARSVFGRQDTKSSITDSNTNKYIYFKQDGSFSTSSQSAKAISLIASHKYLLAIDGSNLPDALYPSRFYVRTQGAYATTHSIYMPSDRAVDCAVFSFSSDVSNESVFAMLATDGTSSASSYSVNGASVIDLTKIGLDSLTAQQAYERLKPFLTHAATGHSIPILADTYENANGIITRRVGSVDLGTLNWTGGNTYGETQTDDLGGLIKPISSASIVFNGTSKYSVVTANQIYHSTTLDNVMAQWQESVGTGGRITILDTALIGKTAAEVKTALSGVILNYELKEYQTEICQSAMIRKKANRCVDANGSELVVED